MIFRLSTYLIASIILLILFSEAQSAVPYIQSKTEFYWKDGNWIPNDRTRYYYDSLSREKYVFYDFFNYGIWNEKTLEEYSYNIDGKKCRLDKYKIDNNIKNNMDRIEYQYYGCGAVKSEIFYSAVDSGWEEIFKWEYTIDENCSKSFEYYYLKADTIWQPKIRNINNYYSDGSLDSYVSQLWDNSGYWANSERKKYIYDSLGRIIRSYWQLWHNDGWAEDELREYSYNDEGAVDSIIYSIFKDSVWIGRTRNIIVYNDFRQIKEKLTEKFVDGKWLPDNNIINDFNRDTLLTEIHYHYRSGDWIEASKYIYEFGDPPIADIPEEEKIIFHVFPVPASDFINIRFNTVDSGSGIAWIIDLEGRYILSRTIFNSGCDGQVLQIDISEIPAGAYQLVYIYGKKKVQRMFVKN